MLVVRVESGGDCRGSRGALAVDVMGWAGGRNILTG